MICKGIFSNIFDIYVKQTKMCINICNLYNVVISQASLNSQNCFLVSDLITDQVAIELIKLVSQIVTSTRKTAKVLCSHHLRCSYQDNTIVTHNAFFDHITLRRNLDDRNARHYVILGKLLVYNNPLMMVLPSCILCTHMFRIMLDSSTQK